MLREITLLWPLIRVIMESVLVTWRPTKMYAFWILISALFHIDHTNLITMQALVSSWKKGDTMPFIFDTVIIFVVYQVFSPALWICSRDLLMWFCPSTISGVGLDKIGRSSNRKGGCWSFEDRNYRRITWRSVNSKMVVYMMKQSLFLLTTLNKIFPHLLSGMHAWFGAAADTRYSVVVPIIGVQVNVSDTHWPSTRVHVCSLSIFKILGVPVGNWARQVACSSWQP